jgi:hypothetical protein
MLYKENYWGKESWTNLNEESCFGYCATDNCWENICPGPPIYKKKKHAIGLGLVDSLEYFVHMQTGYTRRYSLIYFSIYGNNYGNQVTLGINERDMANNLFQLYPNPANNMVYVKNKTRNTASLYIYNIVGKQLMQLEITDNIGLVDVSSLNTGVYLFRMVSGDKTAVQKLVIE